MIIPGHIPWINIYWRISTYYMAKSNFKLVSKLINLTSYIINHLKSIFQYWWREKFYTRVVVRNALNQIIHRPIYSSWCKHLKRICFQKSFPIRLRNHFNCKNHIIFTIISSDYYTLVFNVINPTIFTVSIGRRFCDNNQRYNNYTLMRREAVHK